ncbi:MAG: flavoprotein, partial [bacterium]
MNLDELKGEKRFEGLRVILGVTGGIAAYKSCILVRRLIEEGAEVQVVMTSSAQQFIAPLTFATLSGRNVLCDMFPQPPPPVPIHLTPAQWGKILIVAPATANFLAQVAQGLANDLLSLITLAFNGPCLLAPAMNSQMWENRAVQENIAILKKRGFQLVGPNWGEM